MAMNANRLRAYTCTELDPTSADLQRDEAELSPRIHPTFVASSRPLLKATVHVTLRAPPHYWS